MDSIDTVREKSIVRPGKMRRPIAVYTLGLSASVAGLALNYALPAFAKSPIGAAATVVLVFGGLAVLAFSTAIDPYYSRQEFRIALRGYLLWLASAALVGVVCSSANIPFAMVIAGATAGIVAGVLDSVWTAIRRRVIR